MIRLAATALMLVAATQAAALTCARPDPLRDFRDAQAAPERYVVLYGRLDFDPGRFPQGRPGGPPGNPPLGAPDMLADPVPARFDGFALTPEGFTAPLRTPVTLQPVCAGPWCGSFGPGMVLLFAKVTDAGYEVLIGPCGGGAFDQVDQAVLGQLAACMRGEACGE